MSKFVKAIVGVVEIVAGVITGNPFLIIAGVGMLGSALLTPSLKQQDRQAQATSLQLGEVPRSGLFGDAVTAGSLLDAFNYGGQYGTDWEVLPIGLADHRCSALVGFYVNDVFVSYSGTPGTPWTVPGYNSQLVVTFHDGRADQAADPTMTAQGDWASTDTLAGLCYVVIAYKADDAKASNPVWTGGRPRFKFRVQGKLCYDPRKDSTVAGGSGSHRWDDPTTWEYTDNVAICRYNWVRGIYACDRVSQPEQLLVGRGLSAAEAPPENVAWRANICDEDVALAGGGTEKRYRCGVIVGADETYLNTEEMWAAACAGVIRQPQGSVEVDPGHAITPTFTITDADLVTGEKVTFNRLRSDSDTQWVNTVIPRYVEPSQGWADHAAPIRRIYADVIADGGPREATQSLVAVTSGTQAQRCGEITRRMGRLWRYGDIVLGPRFAGVEDGDWGVWTSDRHTRGAPMMVRVESCAINESWRNSLSLREIATSVFNWSTADEIAPGSIANANTEPTFGAAPGASAWSVTGGNVTNIDGVGVPALIITGAVDDAFADAIIVEYREDGATTWQADTVLDPSTVRRVIAGVGPTIDYEVAISYQVRGVVGARRILGSVTAGTSEALSPSALLTNESQTLPAASDGTVSSYAGATGDFKVFSGLSDVSSSFSLSTPTGGNPQSLTVGYSGQTYTVTAGFDTGEDNANLTIRATGGGPFAGVTIDKVFSLSKSKAGEDGDAPPLMKLEVTSFIFPFDKDDNPIALTNVFKATRQNTTHGTEWHLYDSEGGEIAAGDADTMESTGVFTKIDDDTISMTEAQFGDLIAGHPERSTFTVATVIATTDVADRASVSKVKDGATGASAKGLQIQSSLLTIALDSDGDVISDDTITIKATPQNAAGGVAQFTLRDADGTGRTGPSGATTFAAAIGGTYIDSNTFSISSSQVIANMNSTGTSAQIFEVTFDNDTSITAQVSIGRTKNGADGSSPADLGFGVLADGSATLSLATSGTTEVTDVSASITCPSGGKWRLTLGGGNSSRSAGSGIVVGVISASVDRGGGDVDTLYSGQVLIAADGTMGTDPLTNAAAMPVSIGGAGAGTLLITHHRGGPTGNSGQFDLAYTLEALP